MGPHCTHRDAASQDQACLRKLLIAQHFRNCLRTAYPLTVPREGFGQGCCTLRPPKSDDGRLRFGRSTREEVRRPLTECMRRRRPDLEIGLCVEDKATCASLGLQGSIGRCICVL
jgi:hypothetical protein